MENLDLLWELQKHDNILKDIKDDFQQKINIDEIKGLEIKLNQTEKELIDLENNIDQNEEKLNKNHSMLRDYDYHLKEVEKDLYKGNITDLKQLDFLDNERKSITKNIGDKEIEILEQLEEMEDLKKEFARIEDDFTDFKQEYNSLVKEYKITVEDFKQKVIESKEDIDKISSKIEKKMLKRYAKIKRNKGDAVAEVINCKCGGCNMMIPTFVIDKLKNHDEIVFCESCGRILYLKT